MELDPLGVKVDDEWSRHSSGGTTYNSGATGFYGTPRMPDMGCRVQGIPTPCDMALRQVNSGAADPCQGTCGPRWDPNRDGQGHGGFRTANGSPVGGVSTTESSTTMLGGIRTVYNGGAFSAGMGVSGTWQWFNDGSGSDFSGGSEQDGDVIRINQNTTLRGFWAFIPQGVSYRPKEPPPISISDKSPRWKPLHDAFILAMAYLESDACQKAVGGGSKNAKTELQYMLNYRNFMYGGSGIQPLGGPRDIAKTNEPGRGRYSKIILFDSFFDYSVGGWVSSNSANNPNYKYGLNDVAARAFVLLHELRHAITGEVHKRDAGNNFIPETSPKAFNDKVLKGCFGLTP